MRDDIDSTQSWQASHRYLMPLAGLAIALSAWLLQNVLEVFSVDAIAQAIRSLSTFGLLLALAVIGLIEATVIVCLYVPGTAILIVLLLALDPGGAEALWIVAALNAGTIAGYALSHLLGGMLQARLPALVGETYVNRTRALIARYGAAGVGLLAFHPNNLSLAFAVIGYSAAGQTTKYLAIAVAAQNVWWLGYASVAHLIAQQQIVTRSNFHLYLAALFALWLGYELLRRRARQHP